jgi:hypothetical protein
VDKWVSLGYEHKSGIAKALNEQELDLGWVSADKEAGKVGAFQRLDAAGNDTQSLERQESTVIGPQSDHTPDAFSKSLSAAFFRV